jgi:hypothetical protein
VAVGSRYAPDFILHIVIDVRSRRARGCRFARTADKSINESRVQLRTGHRRPRRETVCMYVGLRTYDYKHRSLGRRRARGAHWWPMRTFAACTSHYTRPARRARAAPTLLVLLRRVAAPMAAPRFPRASDLDRFPHRVRVETRRFTPSLRSLVLCASARPPRAGLMAACHAATSLHVAHVLHQHTLRVRVRLRVTRVTCAFVCVAAFTVDRVSQSVPCSMGSSPPGLGTPVGASLVKRMIGGLTSS